MNYTPYSHLSDTELVLHVCTMQNPTDLELELMLRFERVQEQNEALQERLGDEGPPE